MEIEVTKYIPRLSGSQFTVNRLKAKNLFLSNYLFISEKYIPTPNGLTARNSRFMIKHVSIKKITTIEP